MPKTKDPTILVIDMKKYVAKIRDHNYYGLNAKARYIDAIPSDVNVGRQIAKDVELAKRLPDLKRIDILIPEGIRFDFPADSIWKGLLGPSARKLGPTQLAELIDTNDPTASYKIMHYLTEEQGRIDARAKKKAKAEAMKSPDAWTDPVKFFIPEIGTILKLNFDWTFSIYQERRNKDFINLLNLFGGRSYPDWRAQTGPATELVQIRAGSELKVDRIYIRKGAEEYSSITFWLGKDSVIVGPDGKQYAPNKGIRFWAKLADVNRIQALVNKASVPGLE